MVKANIWIVGLHKFDLTCTSATSADSGALERFPSDWNRSLV